MPTEHVNDIQMYYEIHGEGEPLVLISGLGTDISEWGDLIRWLAQHYRVIAPDTAERAAPTSQTDPIRSR